MPRLSHAVEAHFPLLHRALEMHREKRKQRHIDNIRRLSALGSGKNAWDTLRLHGEYLPREESSHRVILQDGTEKGTEISDTILPRIPLVFADEQNADIINYLRPLPGDREVREGPAREYVDTLKTSDNLLASFSGFSSPTQKEPKKEDNSPREYIGTPRHYEEEAATILEVIDYLTKSHSMDMSLVLHGGTRYGVPALANTIATEYGLKRMASISRVGLGSLVDIPAGYESPKHKVAPIDVLEIIGTDFGHETKSIGTMPDVLFCMGGGPNTVKEIQYSLDAGNAVFLIQFDKQKDTPGNKVPLTSRSTFTDKTNAKPGEKKGTLIRVNVPGDANNLDFTNLHKQIDIFLRTRRGEQRQLRRGRVIGPGQTGLL